MTISLKLPAELEQRLLAEVRSGRHATVEDAILEKLSHGEDPDLLKVAGMSADDFRRDLNDAWDNRIGAVDGPAVFARLRAKGDGKAS